VCAYNSGGESDFTSCAAATTGLAGSPNSPTDLKAVSKSSSRILSWTDNSTDETSFQIHRKVNASPWNLLATVGANAMSYRDTTATGNISTNAYKYFVVACNAAGCSPSTNTAVVPFAPSGLTATAVSSSQIDLAWVG
jgi:titin